MNGKTLGDNQPEKQYTEVLRYGLIPLWYSNSYKIVAIAYTLLYMLFVLMIVLAVGGMFQQEETRRWKPGQPSVCQPAASGQPAEPNSPATENRRPHPAVHHIGRKFTETFHPLATYKLEAAYGRVLAGNLHSLVTNKKRLNYMSIISIVAALPQRKENHVFFPHGSNNRTCMIR